MAGLGRGWCGCRLEFCRLRGWLGGYWLGWMEWGWSGLSYFAGLTRILNIPRRLPFSERIAENVEWFELYLMKAYLWLQWGLGLEGKTKLDMAPWGRKMLRMSWGEMSGGRKSIKIVFAVVAGVGLVVFLLRFTVVHA